MNLIVYVLIILFWAGLLGFQVTAKSIREQGKYWVPAFIIQLWTLPSLLLFGEAVAGPLLTVAAILSII